MKQLLITGAGGSIGTDVVEHLSSFATEYAVFESHADVTNMRQVSEEMKVIDPDVVVHLAALVGTKNCEEVPRHAVQANVLGTMNVVEATLVAGARLVYFSTTAIYKPGVCPIREDSPVEPGTVYPLTKLWGEQLARRYVPKRDLIVFRPCFGFGGRGDRTSMLAALVRSHFSGNYVSLLIDMDKRKDYTHVRNFSHALHLMLQGNGLGFGEDWNVSGGEPKQYAEIIDKLIARGIHPRYKNFPELDYGGDHVVLNDKARHLLGYKPVVTFDEGLDALITGFKGEAR